METKSISPQFHVVSDDGFTPLQKNEKDLPLIWDRLIMSESIKLRTLAKNNYSELSDDWLT